VLLITRNFDGSTVGVDTTSTPPDSDGAAGPAHFAEFINGRFSVYNKTNGIRVQTFGAPTFWSRAGVSLPVGWAVTDPRMIYDPSSQRWFASEVDFDPSLTVITNRFLLAVSATADPTGTWNGVAFPSDSSGFYAADFPTLGLDTLGVYISAILFDANQNAVGSSLFSIPKSALLAATPSAAGRTGFGVLTASSRGQVLQPAITADAFGGGNVLAVGNLGLNFLTNTTLKASTVLNAAGPGAATLSSATTITVNGYFLEPNPAQPNPLDDVDDGDCRFSGSVKRVGGVLYAVHCTVVNSRSAIRWYRISATNYTRLESGTIADSNLSLFYPSIAANTNGMVVIGCNGSSANTFISAYAISGQTTNGVTTFGNLLLLKSGLASYSDNPAGNPSRLGDYSTTCLDPLDPTRFWTIQMYPIDSQTWRTHITQLLTSLPRLTIAASGANLMVCRPVSAADFQLQSTTKLSTSAHWSPVAQTASTNGTQLCVLVPKTGAQFFRLMLVP